MEDDYNLSEEEKIEQENLLLQSEIIIRGGMIGDSKGLPPEIENQFLKNILAFENAERKPISEIIGVSITDYPVANKLTENEITKKLDELIEVFEKNEIALGLIEGMPDRLVYKFLVEEYLFDKDNLHPVGISGWVIDGCSGDCPSCFQLEYCSSKDDTWPPDELAAEIKRRKEEDF
jgi:hypothetical protein